MAVYITDDTGTRRQVVNAWYSDGISNRGVRCIWVGESGGNLRKSDDCVGAVQITVSPLNHTTLRVQWSAPGADHVEIRHQATPTAVIIKGDYPSPTGSFDYGGYAPNATLTFYARAFDDNGSTDSQKVSVTMPTMPAPASISAHSPTTTSFVLDWAAVSATSRYDVYNADTNGVLYNTTATTRTETGVPVGATHNRYVKAVHATGATSPASATASVTTLNRFRAGNFAFFAHACDTWQASGSWRGTSAGLVWHGDGHPWTSGGTRRAYFFDYREQYTGQTVQQFFAGPPAQVSQVRVRTYRSAVQHGVYSAQTCRYQRHVHASRPGTPSTYGEYVEPGSLALGQWNDFNLPPQWGQEWISGTMMGMIWGGTPALPGGAGYMYGPDLAHAGDQMVIQITTV